MTNNKRILIAGGAGFIGSRLVPTLVERGHDVVVLDLLWFGNHLPPDVEVIQKEVLDLNKDDLIGFDQVIFLAGFSNDPMAEYSPKLNYIFNASSPAYLAHIAKKAGVGRFIYASTCSVYGDTGDILGTEETPTKCTYPYGISKLQGEVAVMQLVDDDFSVISLRSGTTAGYSPRMRFDLLINTLYMSAMTKGKLIMSNPKTWRPVLAISDSIEAYVRSVEVSNVSGIFNIASENITLGDAALKVTQHFLNRIEIEVVETNDPRNYSMSTEKAKKILGVKLEEDVFSILKELDRNVGKDFDFENENYYNVKTFKKINV